MPWTDIADAEAGSSVRTKLNRLGGGSECIGFPTGNWFTPWEEVEASAGNSLATNLKLLPFRVREAVTISDIGIALTGASAGGLMMAGIYAHDNAARKPTGNALIGATALSTTTTGGVAGGLSASVACEPGIYWMGVMADNGTCRALTSVAGSLLFKALVGSPTLSQIAQTSGLNYTAPATFGTLPDLTGATLSYATGTSHCMVLLKAA